MPRTLLLSALLSASILFFAGTPATGFVLYVDQADGGLKAKSSGGTVTALAAY